MKKARPPTRKTIVAASAGSALEWYDFSVYGFLAPIIGKTFFPNTDPASALLLAFGALTVGYLSRPFGSFIFGHIGDVVGRKPAMLISVSIMGLCALLLAILPTYEQIGIAAGVLLVAIRIIQGIAVAGEYTASAVLLTEAARPGRRALTSSWVVAAMFLGCMAASGITALIGSIVGEDALQAWGWRIAFLLGCGVALVIGILRTQMPETLAAREKPAVSPALLAVTRHAGSIARIFLILMPNAILYFIIFVYASSYWTGTMKVPTTRALEISTANLAALTLAIPLVAFIGDRVGYWKVIGFGAVFLIVASLPLWHLMHHDSVSLMFLGQFGLTLGLACYAGLSVITMVDLSPDHTRCSTVSLGYNTAVAFFGGTTPLIATWLTSATGRTDAPVYYLLIAAALSLFVVARLPKQQRSDPG